MIRILRTGNWTPSQVRITWSLNTRQIITKVESAIETAWQTALARPGVHLFDGPMCRLESWTATDDQLNLTLSKSNYKTFLGTNMAHPEFADQFGPQVMANPLGVSPALRTSDGYILLGRRNASVAYYPGRVHPFAGSMEPTDADPFAAIFRELHEELSLGENEIRDIRCTGIAQDQSLRQPELIFAAASGRSRAQIEASLDPVEHHAMWSMPASANAIANATVNDQTLTPVAVAALVLWGRIEFGQNWFDETIRLAC
jgi:8-oxo-dGTP pyrophosphatase MutT (NUDIX family)